MKTVHVVAVALLGVTGAVSAQRPVDFEEETHFRCYVVSTQTPEPAEDVTLSDQFIEGAPLTIDEPLLFCPPTSKNGLEIEEPEEHLTMYGAAVELSDHLIVATEDQFGPRTLRIIGARYLMVPTQKLVGGLEFPEELNHSWCYEAEGERVRQTVSLEDQFGTHERVRVERPKLFCNPVEKIHGTETAAILEPEVHLTCYEIFTPQRTRSQQFGILNQFEEDLFTVTSSQLLCVPSAKGEVMSASVP
jgi:hypothetical protein